MKIKSHRIISAASGKDMTSSSIWITAGKEYIVLALYVYPHQGISVCLFSDHNNNPISHSLLGFEVVSEETPKHWVTRIDEDGIVRKMPEKWFAENFFEDVEDHIPEAVKIFLEEAAIAYKEEGEILSIKFEY